MRYELTEKDRQVVLRMLEHIYGPLTGRAYWLTFAKCMLFAALVGFLLAESPLRQYPWVFLVGLALAGEWYVGRLHRKWFDAK